MVQKKAAYYYIIITLMGVNHNRNKRLTIQDCEDVKQCIDRGIRCCRGEERQKQNGDVVGAMERSETAD
jgi:hypothetical protein